MKELIELLGLLEGNSVLSSIIVVGVFGTIIFKGGQLLWNGGSWVYRKIRGIETEKEKVDKVNDAIVKLRGDMEEQLAAFEAKENADMKELVRCVQIITEKVDRQEQVMQAMVENDKVVNRAILRNSIVSSVRDLKADNWECSPATKQNLDDLFALYLDKNVADGNGEVKMLKEELYDKHVKVNMDIF